ncbi:MAG: hypothetical protein R3D65_08660 [Zhengella sp.]|uniref:hypothetical protein n=1 Tax=Zhengella sp. TaxID=2282762 RepID=UPI001DC62975|nr:hypothetical protein [Notoacmeibacter sp.]MCC0025573.1 hypothetical protein [Brucellaceae bacterium]
MQRPSRLNELATMMIKQAKLLKHSGLVAEARELARRALALRSYDRLAMQPVRIRVRR